MIKFPIILMFLGIAITGYGQNFKSTECTKISPHDGYHLSKDQSKILLSSIVSSKPDSIYLYDNFRLYSISRDSILMLKQIIGTHDFEIVQNKLEIYKMTGKQGIDEIILIKDE